MEDLPVIGALVAFAAVLAAIQALKPVAPALGLVDHPGGRKQHRGEIPLVGGIAIFVGLLVGLPAGYGIVPAAAPLVTGMAALLALGIVDDARGMRGITKLGCQVAVVTLVVIWGGVAIERVGALPGIGTVSLGPAAVPFTIFALVGLINAVNMLDGLDGLAGGVVLGGFGWLLLLAGLQGQSLHMAVSGLLLAAVAAFLLLNARLPWRPRAEVFLGDAGSMSLGLALGWCIVGLSQVEAAVISPVAYLWVVAVPVIDTLSLMVRRVLRGRHPFSADRDHLHHLFLRAGFTPGEASYCLVGISLAAGGIGILGGLAGVPDWLLAVALLGVLVGHYVFIRHAWRTVGALRRLNRVYQDAHVNQVPVRRGALVGFYVAVFCAPVSVGLSLAGLALVYLATALDGRAFLADLRRTPLAGLALVVAAFLLLRGGVGAVEDHSLWTHLLPLTGLYSIPLGWWLLRLRSHRLWLLGALAAGLLVAFVQDARWGDLRAGVLGDPLAWGANARLGLAQVVALLLLLAIMLRAVPRLGRGWRARFALAVAGVLCVPLVIILVGSFYVTAWIGTVAGILVLGAGAVAFHYGRSEWLGLAGGVALVAAVALGSWQLVADQGPVRTAVAEPVQAALLYLDDRPRAAGEVHPATAERLWLMRAAAGELVERPLIGHGWKHPPARAGLLADGQGHYPGMLTTVAVGFGLVGLALFTLLFVGFVWTTLAAAREGVWPVSWALGLVACFTAAVTMLTLAIHVDHGTNRTMLILLLAAGFAAAFYRCGRGQGHEADVPSPG
ncbi:hypothetical protein [Arhodomonas sp. SL1]|uniref:hypothetical protein n=1 Tax=Arhodomonas sp. SL1 TaxID=3425691 RepID=UPI003F881344